MSSQSSGSIFSRIKGELETYIEARATLFQLETTEKISRLMGMISVVFVAGTLLLLFLLCLSLMAGYFFAQQFDSYVYGFALVAGFYFFLFLILLTVGKKKLATFVTNKILKALFNRTAENDD